MAVDPDAYVTLVLSDNYLPGAAVLAHSLRDAGTSKKLAVMVTLDSLRVETLNELKSLYDYVLPVDRISNPNPANLYLLNRGDLLHAFTKLNVWRLTQFRRIVFLDADVVALRAPDELFDTDSPFSAAPDIGWPDAFNSGVMALKPHMGTYWALHTLASSGDSFDGADQGLLNQYFEHKDWHRLSFTYNCTPNASYQYEPAYRYNKSKISMIHFIGSQKPWVTGRSSKAESPVYKELVNRWWAVYDMHYRSPLPGSGTAVQSQVKGERVDYGYSSVSLGPAVTSTEPSLTDSANRAEEIVQGNFEPTSTVEQRRFSAPQNEWDATRAPPPAESKPEAQNFPTQVYDMSGDTKLFKAPKAYPEPPKDMWYEVPKERPAPPTARPKAIFPWEERQPDRPSRVFAEDLLSPEPEPTSPVQAFTAGRAPASEPSRAVPTTNVVNDDLPTSFGSTSNVWDSVAGIDSYIRSMTQHQKLRGKLQVLHNAPKQALSPAEEGNQPQRGRRESLVLTDFPSAIERPSLPVTPAPQRKSFWGSERDQTGQLPQAEGVPDQAEWDPSQKLEELRRQSLQMDSNTLSLPSKNVPRRDMPRSSVIAEEGSDQQHVRFQQPNAILREPAAASGAKPAFSSVDFAGATAAESKEEVMSPTEHGIRDA